MANNISNQNYTEAVQTPASDTMTQILGRIESLMQQAYENENGLDSILLMVKGPSGGSAVAPSNDLGEKPPSHIIFTAKQIEQRLEAHFHAAANAIRKISDAL
jgi:hypothetical protein